jgi:ABC-type Fe3+-hydroxamate transport system substrate-binding protein
MPLLTAIALWPEGKVAKRIVSLVPSITETLFDLGLEDEVVGITKFCVHPNKWFRHKTRIGGTKNVDIEKVLALQPDLIIANKEENVAEQVHALATEVPVWLADIKTLEDSLQMISDLGFVTGRKDAGSQLANEIAARFEVLPSLLKPLTAAYVIWREPWMVAGGDTFIHHLLTNLGLQNAYSHLTRYPKVDFSVPYQPQPDLVLLSSEPYPFSEKHIAALQQELPNSHLQLVDGEMFSWYGSRLLQAPDYFSRLVVDWNKRFQFGRSG